MTSLVVRAPGLLTTVQDLGRPGFGTIGVSPGGAADPVSLRLGNWLVGNPEGAAALEMTLAGSTFEFLEDAVVALTGADFGSSIDGAPIEPWATVELRAGQTLTVGRTRSGARCYLSVRGGIEVRDVMGSKSTHLLSGLGGFEGRALRTGDTLQIGRASEEFSERRVPAPAFERLFVQGPLRVTPGPQAEHFSEEQMRSLCGTAYRAGEQSDRTGLRLQGELLPYQARMVSEGTSLGAIQITPHGTPIILFVDQQTTGGYMKIANVISADLHRVGQLRPRDEIRFEKVTFDEAHQLLVKQEQLLGELITE